MAVSIATYWYRCWFIHNHNIIVHKHYCDWLTSYWNFMSGNTTHSMYDLSYLINLVRGRMKVDKVGRPSKSRTQYKGGCGWGSVMMGAEEEKINKSLQSINNHIKLNRNFQNTRLCYWGRLVSGKMNPRY